MPKTAPNSSNPSSSNGFGKKSKSQRSKSMRKVSGQKGHKRSTLQKVVDLDDILVHSVEQCHHWDFPLSDIPTPEVEKRQVLDILPLHLQVTEDQSKLKICPCCLKPGKAVFSDGVDSPGQYGNHIRDLMVDLMNYQLIPYERCRAIFKDIFFTLPFYWHFKIRQPALL